MKILITRDDFNRLIRGESMYYLDFPGLLEQQSAEVALEDIGYVAMLNDIATAGGEAITAQAEENHDP